MTTSDSAALLSKHRQHIHSNGLYKFCRFCDSPAEMEWCESCKDAPFPCDVHRMAELKDAEIAQAVSEAVERIVEALEIVKGATDHDDYAGLSEADSSFYEGVFSGNLEGIDRAIALLRSRDWSVGGGDV